MNKSSMAFWFERAAGAFIFLAFGIWEILKPAYWSSYAPASIARFMPVETAIVAHGLLLLCIGLAFFVFRKRLRAVALVASLVLLSIVATLLLQAGWNEILARDIAILLLTLALAAR